jgi:predicted nucleic acid-binding protein
MVAREGQVGGLREAREGGRDVWADQEESGVTVVDASVWIDALRGFRNAQTEWLDRELQGQVALTDLILLEVLRGFGDESQSRRAQAYLQRFVIFETGGVELALETAKNYRLLRRRGLTIRGTIDCLTATFCILEGHTLLHVDRDFDAFEKHLGLKVNHP